MCTCDRTSRPAHPTLGFVDGHAPHCIDSEESRSARVASYVPCDAVAAKIAKIVAVLRDRELTNEKRIGDCVNATFAAITRLERLAGTSYADAPLRYSHEVYSAADRLVRESVAMRLSASKGKKR